jgi:hypothetical protein
MTHTEETKIIDVPKISTMPLDEIERYVALGRQLRSAQFAAWGRRLGRTWASVFRRPGRIVPPSMTEGRYAR